MMDFDLTRNTFGRLVLSATGSDVRHEGVVPVRAFPIAAPETGIAIVDAEGRELAWIEQLSDLPAPIRALLEEELANREFLPEIVQIVSVSTFAAPSTWQVKTNRGMATLILKGEEEIRRITASALMITDAHGVQFLVRDIQSLDKASRKLLDRFL